MGYNEAARLEESALCEAFPSYADYMGQTLVRFPNTRRRSKWCSVKRIPSTPAHCENTDVDAICYP